MAVGEGNTKEGRVKYEGSEGGTGEGGEKRASQGAWSDEEAIVGTRSLCIVEGDLMGVVWGCHRDDQRETMQGRHRGDMGTTQG